MSGLKVLITTWTLQGRHGTAMYVRDLAVELLRQGHLPIVYSPELGEVATELQAATVPVVSDLAALGDKPDVIHGNAHCDTMTALLRFPGVPALFACHAWDSWLCEPPRFPRLRLYVAVDDTCRDWLIWKRGIPVRFVRVVFNAFDRRRFQPRGPLPARPARAAVFSNNATADSYLKIVRQACERFGLPVDVIGTGIGNPCAQPETILGQYDVVFAKARCALEALAVGASVILCDQVGLGPLVTTQNFDELRRLNFGRRALRDPHRPDPIIRALTAYNAATALAVSQRIRSEATLDQAVRQLADHYRAIIAEQATSPTTDIDQEAQAAAHYLQWLTSPPQGLQHLHVQLHHLQTELHASQGRLHDLYKSSTIRLRTSLARVPVLGRYL